ncbi:DNA glycosylase AlkZ-like family protein [Breznakiella homolactica]|uniref:Winged helix DNA-binding domain-containing protein n=1 Tax=Breznakiella homolactica TaxID=2798577 RepID=A0A7T7XLV8_9SPIR|nr:crosslink repair DNA glycosylase YcaQ family protein [Breznakiella homolactica]QQO08761.1 winged helix DNA-binding domain-containing protein [Breznakiella homolactica]
MNTKDLALERLCRNGLLNPFVSPLDCIRNLGGIQSQFQQFAEVSIRNRCTPSPAIQDLAELYRSHRIINLWGQRHTLHMYTAEDWDLVCHVYHNRFFGKNYRDIFPKEFAGILENLNRECRDRDRIAKKDVREITNRYMENLLTENDYFEYALIRHCCVTGLFFGLPEKPAIKTFVFHRAVRENRWEKDINRELPAVGELMARYFEFYGPASLEDFRHWAGLTAGLSKKALDLIRDRLSARTFDGTEYYSLGDIPRAEKAESGGLFLLGKFDPLFVSYRRKDWIVPEKSQKAVWQSAARVEAVVLDGTKALGTWRHSMKGKQMDLRVFPFGTISAASRKRINRRAEELAFFWGKELGSVIAE